jgi:predicted RNA-binding Zn ribbon-like protein
MQPLFLGSHPALDFLNTAFSPAGEHVDMITDGRALLAWLEQAGLMSRTSLENYTSSRPESALDHSARRVRAFREWARSWIEAWRVDPGGDYRQEIAQLNAHLECGSCHFELAEGRKIICLHNVNDENELIALIALTLARLFADEDASLVRKCAGNGCTLLFLDRTKSHRRRFCSASACGNRARVAAFRQRGRG